MTAATKQEVYNYIIADKVYDEILKKYAKRKVIRDELRQHIWLQIGNISDEKLIDAWNKRYFTYLYVAILKGQVVTNDSKWHNNFRQHIVEFSEDNVTDFEVDYESKLIEEETRREKEIKLSYIDEALKYLLKINPHYLTEAELFRMYYQDKLSYGQISKKTNIPKVSVYDYVQSAKTLIKGFIQKKYGYQFNN